MRSAPAAVDDRTTRARIRDAAVARFAAEGVAGTTIRAIAADANVSPGLVIHHFGSKEGLRIACDEHVAAVVRESKHAAMSQGLRLDPLAAMREQSQSTPVLRYLARTLVDGAPHVAVLVDEMVRDATAYMEEGVAGGILKPSRHPYERAAVLTVWSLGALVLHEHVRRLLGGDLLAPADARGYLRGALEIMSDGVLTDAMSERLRGAFEDEADTAAQPHPKEAES